MPAQTEPSGVTNDGGMFHGSHAVTIGGVAGWVLENFRPNETTTAIDSRQEVGKPRAAVYINDKIVGSATALFPLGSDSSTAVPARGDTLSLTYRGATKVFIITRVGLPEGILDERKVEIDIAEQLASS